MNKNSEKEKAEIFPFNVGSPSPSMIFIELTNDCNLRCLMCPRGRGLMNAPGYMTEELFDKILADVDTLDPKPVLAFHLNGEPLLHPRLFDFIAAAKALGFHTSMHTNGVLLDEEKCHALVKCEIDDVTFSFEGEDREFYETLRKGSCWDKVAGNIKCLLAIEKRPEVIIEVLKFRDRDDSLDISGDFKNYFKGASFNSYFASSWRGTLEDEQLSEETSGKPEICSLPLNDMAIGYDGVVKCCTIDYNSDCPLGDLNDELIMDVWLGDRRSDFLKRICNKDYKNIKTCKKCTAPYYAHKKERLRERNCSGE